MPPPGISHPRKIQVAVLVWEGLTNRQIGPDYWRQRASHQEPFAQHFSTNWASGGAWNWPCTSPAMAAKAGMPTPARVPPGSLLPLLQARGFSAQRQLFTTETRSHRETTIIAKPVLGGSLPGFGFHRGPRVSLVRMRFEIDAARSRGWLLLAGSRANCCKSFHERPFGSGFLRANPVLLKGLPESHRGLKIALMGSIPGARDARCI